MKMLLSKNLECYMLIQLTMVYVVFGGQTFMTSFQTDLKGNNLATTNVWIEFSADIPQTKEFTVCHWIKIKLYNSEYAACVVLINITK